MPRERPFQIGPYWLGRETTTPHWQICWYDPARRKVRRQTTRTQDFAAAIEVCENHYFENKNPQKEPPDSKDLREVLVSYYENYAVDLIAKTTVSSAFEIFYTFLDKEEDAGRIDGAATVADLTPKLQKRFREYMGERSPNTKDTYLKYIRAGLNRAKKRGELTDVPFIETYRKSQLNGPRKAHITPEMMAAALRYSHKKRPHLFRFIIASIATIARPQTVLEIHVGKMADMQNRILDLNPPGRAMTTKRRPVVWIGDLLLEWFADEDGYFVQWRGKPVRKIAESFRGMRQALGWPDEIIAKTIRHSVAKTLRFREDWRVDPWDLAGQMGHVAISDSNEVYAQWSPNGKSSVQQALRLYFEELEELAGISLHPSCTRNNVKTAPFDLKEAVSK